MRSDGILQLSFHFILSTYDDIGKIPTPIENKAIKIKYRFNDIFKKFGIYRNIPSR